MNKEKELHSRRKIFIGLNFWLNQVELNVKVFGFLLCLISISSFTVKKKIFIAVL